MTVVLFSVMDEAKIVLDQDTFKALATGTRVKILKTLDKRRHTQSELSAVLDMSVPTVKEHLGALEKTGLVKRNEEGRKWIYYSLTEKAKCVLDPERKRLWIVLGFFLASVAGTIIAARNYFAGRAAVFGGAEPTRMLAAKQAAAEVAVDSAEEAVALNAVPTAAPEVTNQTVAAAVSQPPYVLIVFAVLTIILLILAVYFYKKSKLGKSLNKK
ncbi:metalloregulator ArsR/SmtB family transcription factor [Candidatus Woesearchaeota archaeon]|nr:metalloregulator ArsR/SmtB family transcription factor [Candidatus Woesearchaeota archaeon]